MIHAAHASRHHWAAIGTAENLARGEWLCSRVYAVLGRGEPSMWHARRCLEICEDDGIGDWDIAGAYEAMARASAVAGDVRATRVWVARAREACAAIADTDDREVDRGRHRHHPRDLRRRTMTRISLGALLWNQAADYAEMREAARRVDALGYDHLWAWDHLYAIYGDPYQPILEGWSLLNAWAEATERVRLGLLVGANTFRNPTLVAKLATTLDHVSGGRAILGLGGAWFELEHRAHGIDFGSGDGERLDRLDEAVGIIRRVLDGEEVTHEGRFYRADALVGLPRPVQPHLPILIGGGGEKKTLRTVARYADISNVFGDPETLRRKDAVIRAHCADVGRDEREIERSVGLQDRHPRHRGRGAPRLGRADAPQPDPGGRLGRARHALARDARDDRRDHPRARRCRVPHDHRRAAGAVRRRDDGAADRRGQADGGGVVGGLTAGATALPLRAPGASRCAGTRSPPRST